MRTAVGNSRRVLIVLFLLAVSAWTLQSWLRGGIVALLLNTELGSAEKIDLVREYFLAWGALAPLVYVLVVTVEVVVAPIPGTLLYLPGGVIFGGFVGGTMSLIGNVLGAGVACSLARALGGDFLARRLGSGAMRKYRMLLRRRGALLVFLLRVNPFTSSDLVSYAAGLTTIPAWKVMLGTLFGMAPLCYVQAYFAAEIFTVAPFLLYPLIALCVAYFFGVIWLLWRMRETEGSTGVPREPHLEGRPR
ncbi:MAG: TVP38/TMEM64 family protein [Acidobacteriota bacterium]|nr:MAG: TVP38/TMEM64 family protein [Acidobacteriota bacterium]